ncbi:MAG: ABC transporter ATP-binding protein [Lentimicrobiaceae bacterium]|jgi:iron complex transport system ATP-binding protein|nr:ABC transporter ATP-binding protein [Lentimicrobiaceae bacterium]
MKRKVLETKNLSIGYRVSGKPDIALFPPINITLFEGDIVALAGANGSGKTTLFKTLTDSTKPLSGEVLLFDKNIRHYSATKKASLFSIVLTERPDDVFLKVFDVVASGRYPYVGLWAKLKKSDYEIIEQSLKLTGTENLIDRTFNSLSDGERQKVMISKALAQNTPLIVLDEPAAFLDYPSKIELTLLLVKLAREQHKTILFSSHDLDILMRTADKLWLVARNKPLVSGISEDLAISGLIDNYLSCNDLIFDLKTAQFTIPKQKKCQIAIEPADLCLQWVERALIRKGYEVVKPDGKTLEITSENGFFCFTYFEKKYQAQTIEELLNQIENI